MYNNLLQITRGVILMLLLSLPSQALPTGDKAAKFTPCAGLVAQISHCHELNQVVYKAYIESDNELAEALKANQAMNVALQRQITDNIQLHNEASAWYKNPWYMGLLGFIAGGVTIGVLSK